MKRIFPFLIWLLISCSDSTLQQSKIAVTALTCEYKINPLGIKPNAPRLGWIIESDFRNQKQAACHILVSDDPSLLESDRGNFWNTGKVKSDHPILVNYDGLPLKSGERYYWKVKVWDQDGNESPWSEPASWQMGLLTPDDWKNAQWIGYEEMPDSLRLVPGNHGPQDHLGNKAIRRPVTPLFRKEFQVAKKVKYATLFISGLGQYEATINGQITGNVFLAPGWTFYDKTVFYNVYDITSYLQQGKNAIGVIVGNGFYNINRERYFKINVSFGMPKMIARINICYTDGTEKDIVSGTDWKTSSSPITFNSIYGGEDYDARLEQAQWDMPGFNDSKWHNALAVKKPEGNLVAEYDYPVAVMEELKASDTKAIGESSYVFDFGQSASGIIEIKVRGKKGQQIRFIPGELLNPDKSVKQNNDISGAPYYFTYILKGDGVETWRPRFSYYGFRYVQAEGAVPEGEPTNGLPELIGIKMLHIRNSTPEAGHFNCSNELMNKINSLIKWSIRSNMMSILTDCPHREKLGWLEVNHLMSEAIHYNYDVYHFYSKIIHDMMESQTPEGLVPTIAPEFALMDRYFGDYRDAPVWGSASIVLPWKIYKWYGDTTLMVKAWPMMLKYADYLKSRSNHHIITHGLGDWCELNPNEPGPRLTPTSVMGTAQYYYDLRLLTQMAGVLGRDNEKECFSMWSEEIRKAFNHEFFDKETGIYATGSQASLAVPLAVGLVEDQYQNMVFDNLVKKIRQDGMKLTVGSAGMSYMVQLMIERGASQLFFDMNNRDDAGYGLQLKMGATTLVEPWIPSTEHGSNNHPALGNIMRWFYEGLAGIGQEEDSAGYKEIIIRPQFVKGINEVKASYQSPYGLIRSEWKKGNGSISLNVEIPPNTTAKICFPTGDIGKVTEGGRPIKFEMVKIIGKEAICKVGSGIYSFRIAAE